MNIEFEIEYNKNGRPYINIKNNRLDIEENFFAYEIVRYSLSDMLNKNKNLPEDALQSLRNAGAVVEELSNKIAKMVVERNEAMKDIIGDSTNDSEPKKED